MEIPPDMTCRMQIISDRETTMDFRVVFWYVLIFFPLSLSDNCPKQILEFPHNNEILFQDSNNSLGQVQVQFILQEAFRNPQSRWVIHNSSFFLPQKSSASISKSPSKIENPSISGTLPLKFSSFFFSHHFHLTGAFYVGFLAGLLVVAGMMTLIVRQWIIPANSLRKTHQ